MEQGPQLEFDYVIVGAGSAGCVLASRLTEDPNVKVALVEAGGWDRNPWIRIPLAWPRILLKRMNDWMYFSEPDAALDDRRIECARGKVIGGSSSINAMAHVRGHRGDYDRWASRGLPGWSFDNVLPYFKRLENWEGGSDEYRGVDGPLNVEKNRCADPVCDAFTEAGVAAGYARTTDYNGAQQEGIGAWQTNRRNGRRCSAADAYLRPALRRQNLTVMVDTLVHEVSFNGDCATGISCSQRGKTVQLKAGREVLIAAGAINSPQLLMLSGIGDPAHLKRHNINVRVPLASVGKNLQDHISSPVVYRRKEPGPLHRAMRADRVCKLLFDAYFRGQGLATALPTADMAFLRGTHAGPLPDIQILFVAAPMTAGPYLQPLWKAYADGFAARAAVLRPESRGSVELASSDPSRLAIIRQNFLTRDKDWKVLRDGLRLAQEIGRQRPLAKFIARQFAPTHDSDEALDAHIRAGAITVHHPACTCRMGPPSDPDRVVDEALRVVGTKNLRVIDASVMPDLVGGNINVPVIMIAEKASDLIRDRALHPRDERPSARNDVR